MKLSIRTLVCFVFDFCIAQYFKTSWAAISDQEKETGTIYQC